MSTAISSLFECIHSGNEPQLGMKLVHPRVLKITQVLMPKSPRLEIKDDFQPIKGDLKQRFFKNL